VKRLFSVGLSVVLLALLVAPSVRGDVKTWTGVTGDWFDAANWTNGLPVEGDEVILNRGTVSLTNATPLLGSFTQNGGALVYSNWTTKLWATNVLIAGGTNMLPAAFTNGGMSNRIWIVCTNLFVGSNGQLLADGAGYAGGRSNEVGQGPGGGGWGVYSAGGGHGGSGGKPYENYATVLAGMAYGSVEEPDQPGSGGGAGVQTTRRAGAGGGVIRIEAAAGVTVNGILSANGANAPTDLNNKFGGGGSGGAIFIQCRLFAGTNGTVRAAGGAAGASASGGAGGGGRIAVSYDPVAQATADKPTVAFNAAASLAGAPHETFPQSADLGTLYFSDHALLKEDWVPHSGEWRTPISSLTVNTLIITNGWLRFPGNDCRITVLNDVMVRGASSVLDLGGDAFSTNRFGWAWYEFRFYTGLVTGPVLRVGGSLLVTNGAAIRLHSGLDNADMPGWGCVVAVTNDIVIATGSTIRAWGHPTNGAAPLFLANRLRVDRGGVLSGTEGGYAGGRPQTNGFGPAGGKMMAGYPIGGGHGGRPGESWDGLVGGNTAMTPEVPGPGSGGGGGNGGGANRSTGGSGGALLRLSLTDSLTVNGTIVSDGAQGGYSGNTQWAGGLGYYAAGGAGGGIHITCATLQGTGGLVGARGCRGPRVGYSSAGAGGRIAIVYDTAAQAALPVRASVQFDVAPSLDGTVNPVDPAHSEPGTLWLPDWALLDPLRMNHKGQILVAGATNWAPDRLVVSNGWLRFPTNGFQLTVTNDVLVTGSGARLDIGGNLGLTNWNWMGVHYPYGEMAEAPRLACTALTLTNGASLHAYATRTNGTTQLWGALVEVSGKVSIATNCWIYPYCQPTNGGAVKLAVGELEIQTRNAGLKADGLGFGGNSGPSKGFGPGRGEGNSYGSGAGHGGRGGQSEPGYYYPPGVAYGNSNAPVFPGSSGGGGQIASFFGNGGRGGSRIHIEAVGAVTVNGTITADGTVPRLAPATTAAYGGGGSGGTIWIDCKTFRGTAGLLSADGGNGGRLTYDGGGGGGRIAVISSVAYTSGLQVTVSAGAGYSNGVAGTVRWLKKSDSGTLMLIR
jgi:hypothetical protein